MVEPSGAASAGTAFEGLAVSPTGVAEALQRLYMSPAYLLKMSRAALARATKPAYQWPEIGLAWDGFLEDVLRRRPARQ